MTINTLLALLILLPFSLKAFAKKPQINSKAVNSQQKYKDIKLVERIKSFAHFPFFLFNKSKKGFLCQK